MKVCCCEAAPFGNHCEACEHAAHAQCSRPVEMAVEPDPEIENEIEVAASRPVAKLLHGEAAMSFLSQGGGFQFPPPTPARDGVWVAYHADLSEIVLFDDEVPALRHAVNNSMKVELIPFGVGIREYINRKPEENNGTE